MTDFKTISSRGHFFYDRDARLGGNPAPGHTAEQARGLDTGGDCMHRRGTAVAGAAAAVR